MNLAEIARLGGRLAAGFSRLGRVQQQLACVCELGYLALDRAESGLPYLEKARELGSRASPQRLVRDRLARLERAVEAAELGKALWRGEQLEDLPGAFRSWVEQQSSGSS